MIPNKVPTKTPGHNEFMVLYNEELRDLYRSFDLGQ
jgi:hypothetical protein